MNTMNKMTLEFDKGYKVEITPTQYKFFDIQWYRDGAKHDAFVMGREELLGYLGKELQLVENKSRN